MNFFAYDQNFAGGVRVAAGISNSDGNVEIIAGAGWRRPNIAVFSGVDGNLLSCFFVFNPRLRGHLRSRGRR